MSIDARRFFVRGILHLPVQPAETLIELGIWTEVEEGQFAKYMDRVLEKLNGKLTDKRPLLLKGRLANRLYCLPELFDHAVEIDCSPKLGTESLIVKSPEPGLKNKMEQGLTAEDLSSTFSRFIHEASA
jgi:hypothetical protein